MSQKSRKKKVCVIGWPVEHSLSPVIHRHWMRVHDIHATYDAVAVDHGDLKAFTQSLAERGFAGANVTIPHKESALRLMNEVDPAACAIGAINTIAVGRDGRLTGTNTDGDGFLGWLREAVPAWRAEKEPALVLGAGGAARAIVAALLGAGVPEIRICNRSHERATALAKSAGGRRLDVVPWEERSAAAHGAGLLVNATALGMAAMPPLEIDLSGLGEGAIVYDIVYAPLETPLLSAARKRGLVTVDGLGMLCQQAALAFETWFGILPRADRALRRRLERAISGAGRKT